MIRSLVHIMCLHMIRACVSCDSIDGDGTRIPYRERCRQLQPTGCPWQISMLNSTQSSLSQVARLKVSVSASGSS